LIHFYKSICSIFSMSPAAISRNMFSKIFFLVWLMSVCSAIRLPPLYPFNGGESFTPTPFAPANDQAWTNMMWWKDLAGKPVESKQGFIDPYDEDKKGWNLFLGMKAKDKSIPGITPGAYQKWTQFSNPAAEYIGYGLFSNPLGHKSKEPPLGSTLFKPGNDMFWLMQFLQAQGRQPGDKIENNMLKQYTYLLNSQAPLSVDPYANYWAFKNSLSNEELSSYRNKRSVSEEDEEEDYENDVIEAFVKATVKEDEEAAKEVAAQDDEDEDDDTRGGRSYSMHEATHDEDSAVIDYRDWYENVYLPWYANWERELNEYKLKMLKYEAAHYHVSNPFGDVDFSNPYPDYSKASYTQSLYDDVDGSKGPKKYQKEYDEWKTSIVTPQTQTY